MTGTPTYYAEPRNNTRSATEIREQAATISGLDSEPGNVVLKASQGDQAGNCGALGIGERCSEREDRRGAEDAAAEAAIPDRMLFRPEFLEFMRDTFPGEVMRTCKGHRRMCRGRDCCRRRESPGHGSEVEARAS
ncbi:hypothetical protein MVEN_02548200 [Mycena venus]|uniref:Uncharacterized protein n=1 Tax=Mycena venus TaxID=2733690 RepID=A0A8H6U1U6_9AGAR|nr:hypothetical protein MVEN_02548200 [Mycena venus]